MIILQESPAYKDLERVLPWWTDVKSSAQEAMQSRQPFAGLRVAIICLDLYRFDSISTSVCEQAVVLMAAGCDVQLVCNNRVGINSPLFTPRETFNPAHFDCILYHYYVGDQFLNTVIASSTRKAVYYHGITTPPDVYAPYSPEFVATCRDGLAHLHKLHQFDMVLSASNYNIEQIRASVPQKNIGLTTKIFSPIIAFERFVPAPRRLTTVPTHILTVGRIFSSKNVEGVIRFAELLVKRTGVPTRLTIAGSKCEPAYVQQLLSKTSNHPTLQIDICIRASDERVRELYNKADIYTCFSHHEGFCIPLVESMASGIPVVTHSLTAIPQTMSGSGIVVAPFSYEQAADQILSVFSNKDRLDSLISHQRAVFQRLYTGATIAGELIDVIRYLAFPHEIA